MTLAATAHASQAEGSWLAVLLDAVRGLVQGLLPEPRLSDAERRLLEAARSALKLSGEAVLGASSLTDLDMRLHAAVASAAVASAINKIAAASVSAAMDIVSPRRRVPLADTLVSVVGEGQLRLLNEVERLFSELSRIVMPVLGQALQMGLEVPAEMIDENNPVGFLTDPEVPSPIGVMMLDGKIGHVALLALLDASARDMRVEPWLALELVTRMGRGLRRSLALVVVAFGVPVSESILPLAERIDLLAIEEEHARTKAAVSQLFAEAAAADSDVFVVEPKV